MDGKRDLLAFSDTVFERTRNRLAGLTDDEYFWEPVDRAWSVRVAADGEAINDWAPLPDAPPFTTLAWRLLHMTDLYGEERISRWLLGRRGEGAEKRCAARGNAADALVALDTAHDHWRTIIASLGEDSLEEPLGPRAGPWADSSKAGFVLHIIDEASHHGAELGLLRDLYPSVASVSVSVPARRSGISEVSRASGASGMARAESGMTGAEFAAPVDAAITALLRGERPADDDLIERIRTVRPDLLAWAAANGYWLAVTVLVDLGFAVTATHNGTTPLHQAAAGAPLSIVRLLVDHGADQSGEDEVFHTTPIGWARYFHRRTIVAFLLSGT